VSPPPDARSSPEGEPVDNLSSPHQAITEERQSERTARVKVRADTVRAYDIGRSYAWWTNQYLRAGCIEPKERTITRIPECHAGTYDEVYGEGGPLAGLVRSA
jgi:hypothetical protein